MARMINSVQTVDIGVKLSTIFEDGNENTRAYKVGDIVENLRYVEDKAIKVVSGKITGINYTLASKLTWNKSKPANTLVNDITLVSLTIDNSEKYAASTVTVPMKEIVEFVEEVDVKRMMFEPFVDVELDLSYSDNSTQHISVSVGDTFDKVVIMNPNDIGNDITGRFTVIAFAYKAVSGKVVITGIAFENTDTGLTTVADLDYIFKLNELFTYNPESVAELMTAIASLQSGDTLVITTDSEGNALDTAGHAIVLTGDKEITVDMQEDIVADNANDSGLQVQLGAVVTLSGSGVIKSETPYDKNHATGPVRVTTGGTLIFNGSGISAVIEDDPVNKGQFGVCVYNDGNLTINGGEFIAGWYAVTTQGVATEPESVIEINGGKLVSTVDYAIYFPGKGKLIINGGLIDGGAGALCAQRGTIEINGGILQAFGTGNTGDASDGTGGLGNAVLNFAAKYGDIKATITGGTFIAKGDAILVATGTKYNVDLSISGGKFSSKPEESWIADGYYCTDEADEDGLFEVLPKPTEPEE